MGQRDVAAMTNADIRAAERNEFRPEVERAVAANDAKISTWYGTRRQVLGGRYALVTSYAITYPNGSKILKSTFSVYLGSIAVHVHVFQPAALTERSRAELDRLLSSIRFDLNAE